MYVTCSNVLHVLSTQSEKEENSNLEVEVKSMQDYPQY